jgi:hypothetical protein
LVVTKSRLLNPLIKPLPITNDVHALKPLAPEFPVLEPFRLIWIPALSTAHWPEIDAVNGSKLAGRLKVNLYV